MVPAAQVLPLWRAPGGRTTPNALAMAAACGLRHQGWTANGFWGDELDSAAHPNATLARRAIACARDGEVIVLHWGVRSRQDPFAGVLDEVIGGPARPRLLLRHPAGPRDSDRKSMTDLYARLTGWIFETLIQPALYALGLMDWAEDAYGWLDFGLFGLLTIAVVYAVCRPLEAWRPVEPRDDRRAVRTDMVYTFLARLGVLPLLAFVLLASLQSRWEGWLTEAGLLPPTLEEIFPVLRVSPLLALVGLRRGAGLRRILAAPVAARLPLVVGAACDPPRPAADDLLDRRPQPHPGRRAGRALVRRDRPADRRAAGAVPHHRPAAAAGREPVATPMSGSASAGWGSGCWSPRASTGCTTGSFRPAPRAGTSRCCCRSGTGSSAPPTGGATTSRRTGVPGVPEELATGGWFRQQVLGLRGVAAALRGR